MYITSTPLVPTFYVGSCEDVICKKQFDRQKILQGKLLSMALQQSLGWDQNLPLFQAHTWLYIYIYIYMLFIT